MLDRLRQFEGADQVALFGAPSPSILTRLYAILRRAILG